MASSLNPFLCTLANLWETHVISTFKLDQGWTKLFWLLHFNPHHFLPGDVLWPQLQHTPLVTGTSLQFQKCQHVLFTLCLSAWTYCPPDKTHNLLSVCSNVTIWREAPGITVPSATATLTCHLTYYTFVYLPPSYVLLQFHTLCPQRNSVWCLTSANWFIIITVKHRAWAYPSRFRQYNMVFLTTRKTYSRALGHHLLCIIETFYPLNGSFSPQFPRPKQLPFYPLLLSVDYIRFFM